MFLRSFQITWNLSSEEQISMTLHASALLVIRISQASARKIIGFFFLKNIRSFFVAYMHEVLFISLFILDFQQSNMITLAFIVLTTIIRDFP